jgi:hypothetical protein
LGWSANGAELGRWMGMPADDSVNTHVSIYFRSVILIFLLLRTRTTQREPLGSDLVV